MSSFVIHSTSRTGGPWLYDKRIFRSGSFSRRIEYINVGDIDGDYFIRCHAHIAWSDARSILKVYRIWGEDAGGNVIVGSYKPSGYRISPYYDLSDVNVAINSLIKINSIKPDGTDLKVFSLITDNTDIPDVDNPGWEEQTNNTALTVINPTENYQNKYLWLKTVLSSNISQTSTPSLQEIEIFVYTAYVESGYRISPS